VTSYGQSAQRLLEREPGGPPQVREIVGRILVEAERAAEVVRRLRDFFRAGTTRLEEVRVERLLAAARRAGEAAIAGRDMVFEVEAQPGLAPLYVDRLQVEVILRNLIANAVESLAAARRPGGRVRVAFERHGESQARIVVADNGPGVSPSVRESLFEPFVSGKSTGMGLGLAVSRAIAEAHGGSLEAVPVAHGEFHLILPCAPNA
jgi:signal transduction histidine kinase